MLVMIKPLLKKAANGGNPLVVTIIIRNKANVTGIALRKPAHQPHVACAKSVYDATCEEESEAFEEGMADHVVQTCEPADRSSTINCCA